MMQDTTWRIEKTEATAPNGMVASMHPAASAAGLEMLKAGGNAVDAAAAAAFASGVVEPFMSGLGGVACLVFYRASDGTATVVDGSGVAPSAAREDMYELAPGNAGLYGWPATRDDAHNTGHRAVAVPGMPAALLLALERFGTLDRARVLDPAIRLAEEGFDLDWYVASMIAFAAPELNRFPATARVFFKPGGAPYKPAISTEGPDRFRQPDLARSLKLLAEQGPSAYYEGEIADAIAREMAECGGIITRRDLAAYRPMVSPGLESGYLGLRLVGPRLAGNPTLFEALNILECFDLKALKAPSGTSNAFGSGFYHVVAEASRRAFLDRFAYLGDPAFVPVPWEGLLSREYARELASTINLDRATPEIQAGDPWAFQRSALSAQHSALRGGPAGQETTTHMTVIDRDRNMVALTSTLLSGFGSKVVVPGTGILLNNGMGWFDPRPGFPNSIAPGKRCLWAVAPTLVLEGGKPFMALGSPGGRRLITAVLQAVAGVANFGLGMQEAVGYPRVHCEGQATEADRRIGDQVLERLRAMGHLLRVREEGFLASHFARPNGILVDPDTGQLRGGVNQFKPAWAMGM